MGTVRGLTFMGESFLLVRALEAFELLLVASRS